MKIEGKGPLLAPKKVILVAEHVSDQRHLARLLAQVVQVGTYRVLERLVPLEEEEEDAH